MRLSQDSTRSTAMRTSLTSKCGTRVSSVRSSWYLTKLYDLQKARSSPRAYIRHSNYLCPTFHALVYFYENFMSATPRFQAAGHKCIIYILMETSKRHFSGVQNRLVPVPQMVLSLHPKTFVLSQALLLDVVYSKHRTQRCVQKIADTITADTANTNAMLYDIYGNHRTR